MVSYKKKERSIILPISISIQLTKIDNGPLININVN